MHTTFFGIYFTSSRASSLGIALGKDSKLSPVLLSEGSRLPFPALPQALDSCRHSPAARLVRTRKHTVKPVDNNTQDTGLSFVNGKVGEDFIDASQPASPARTRLGKKWDKTLTSADPKGGGGIGKKTTECQRSQTHTTTGM